MILDGFACARVSFRYMVGGLPGVTRLHPSLSGQTSRKGWGRHCFRNRGWNGLQRLLYYSQPFVRMKALKKGCTFYFCCREIDYTKFAGGGRSVLSSMIQKLVAARIIWALQYFILHTPKLMSGRNRFTNIYPSFDLSKQRAFFLFFLKFIFKNGYQ